MIAAAAALLPVAGPADAASAPSPALHPVTSVGPAQARKILRYWTPARMRSARPLGADGLPVPHHPQMPPTPTVGARIVQSPTTYPYVTAGRIFLKTRHVKAFCSGVAVDTPTRRLVLTAGHCLMVREGQARHAEKTSFLEFVPAYDRGSAPFGRFVMESGYVAPRWRNGESPNYDFGAVVTFPNSAGQNVADAVGGGAPISYDLPRRQQYTMVGYPGFNQQRMRLCQGGLAGHNPFSRGLPGPAQTMANCYLQPGSSGGPWFVGEPPSVFGVTSETVQLGRTRRFITTPYFGTDNLAPLLAGL